jgi:hypothetical protein
LIKPFQKSHNTAFRLLTVLLYGPETGMSYLTDLGTSGRYRRLQLRTGACAYSMRMTIPRLKEHLAWLQEISLIGEYTVIDRGLIELTVKLPLTENLECHENPANLA